MRQAPQAIEAFQQAVRLNYALPASWSMLASLHLMTNEAADSAAAADQVATLRKQPPEIVTATGLFLDGDLDRAEPLVRAYLLQHGNHVEAMRLLARIGMARKVYDDAELLLKALLTLAPDYKAARAEYAETLLEQHKHQDARRELQQLLQEDPANRLQYQGLYATASVGLGEHELAVSMYRDLLSGASRRCGPASVDRACAQDAWAPGRGGRIVPQRGCQPTRLRRCVLEPGQPEDLPVHGPGAGAAARL